MNWVSGIDLAAVVSSAGSKDITADVEETGERYRVQIKKLQGLTQKPFAVNIPIGFGELIKYSQKIVVKYKIMI